MGRPRKNKDATPPHLTEEEKAIWAKRNEKHDLLTQDEITQALSDHMDYGIRLTFPDKDHWLITMPFRDAPWYPAVQEKALRDGIPLKNTAWTVSGNMDTDIEDIQSAATLLVNQKRGFGKVIKTAIKETEDAKI